MIWLQASILGIAAYGYSICIWKNKKLDSFSPERQVHLHADACLDIIYLKISCCKTWTCASSQEKKVALYKLELITLTELSTFITKMAVCVPCERFPFLSAWWDLRGDLSSLRERNLYLVGYHLCSSGPSKQSAFCHEQLQGWLPLSQKLLQATSELASYTDALCARHAIFLPTFVREKECVT